MQMISSHEKHCWDVAVAQLHSIEISGRQQSMGNYSNSCIMLAPTCRWCSSLDWYSMKCAMYTWEAQRGKRCSPCCRTLKAGGSGAGSCTLMQHFCRQ